MSAYYAVCAGLATLSLAVLAGFGIASAVELRRTARKVGRLADQLDDRLRTLENVAGMVDHFSRTVRSGWMRGAEFIVGLASALREAAEKRPTQGREEGPDDEEDRDV